MADTGVTLCAIFRIPTDGLPSFHAYEDAVLLLLRYHGGTLQRRLRSADEQTEVHVISFVAAAGFEAYRADPRRAAYAGLLEASGAEVEVIAVVDVTAG